MGDSVNLVGLIIQVLGLFLTVGCIIGGALIGHGMLKKGFEQIQSDVTETRQDIKEIKQQLSSQNNEILQIKGGLAQATLLAARHEEADQKEFIRLEGRIDAERAARHDLTQRLTEQLGKIQVEQGRILERQK